MNVKKWISVGAGITLTLMLSACESGNVKWYGWSDVDDFYITSSSKYECQRIYDRLKTTLNEQGYTVIPKVDCGQAWTGEGLARASVSPHVIISTFYDDASIFDSPESRLKDCNNELEKYVSRVTEENAIFLTVTPCSLRSSDSHIEDGQAVFIYPRKVTAN